MRKIDIIVFGFLIFSTLLWFFGFYFASTTIGKVIFLGMPLWSITCAVAPAVFAIATAIFAVKSRNNRK